MLTMLLHNNVPNLCGIYIIRLQDWVTKNHLDYYPILNLATGRRLEYKGYKRYYPCIEAFNIVSNGSMIQETI